MASLSMTVKIDESEGEWKDEAGSDVSLCERVSCFGVTTKVAERFKLTLSTERESDAQMVLVDRSDNDLGALVGVEVEWFGVTEELRELVAKLVGPKLDRTHEHDCPSCRCALAGRTAVLWLTVEPDPAKTPRRRR